MSGDGGQKKELAEEALSGDIGGGDTIEQRSRQANSEQRKDPDKIRLMLIFALLASLLIGLSRSFPH